MHSEVVGFAAPVGNRLSVCRGIMGVIEVGGAAPGERPEPIYSEESFPASVPIRSGRAGVLPKGIFLTHFQSHRFDQTAPFGTAKLS